MNSELIHRTQTSKTPKPNDTLHQAPKPTNLLKKSKDPLLYTFIGIAIATFFFNFFDPVSKTPPLSQRQSESESESAQLQTRHVLFETTSSHSSHHDMHFNVGGKVPLGLKKKGLRILVTGGAGFVGSHLVDRLIERGDTVIVVDNFFTGRKDNLVQHFGSPRFELIRHDVVESILLEVDQIYHLACPASPVHYKYNPVKTIIFNFFDPVSKTPPLSQRQSESESESAQLQTRHVLFETTSSHSSHHDVHFNVGGKVPLGLKKKGLRILVTGGAGFVGSHLVDRLIERGDTVIVVDNFFTGRKDNLVQHFGSPRFELIRHDVVEPILLEVDQIYHLACPASPVHYKYNPVKTIKTNVVGTMNMLGLAKRVGARFLVTSTSEVYGDPLQHPQVENYWGNVNPIGVRSCYDEGKRTAETLTMDYHRGHGIEVRIARIFNTYGPRMCIDDGRVVSNFVAQALRKEPLTVYGDGKQTRSFQYVSDLVEGLIRLMEGDHVGPFNLGNPSEFTMLELAQVVQETIDPYAKIEFRPNTEDDPHKRKPDITKARELLGWHPTVSLRNGLPLMVKDFKQRIFADKKDRVGA
ncbi:UDP-glucuronic acid decarboxylase 2 [Quercus suber]|uniref:UDP-glucuronic acid decarboxylase 2 n=1 Tax=Quercus suber TaxID=58331 RepID=UPI0032E0537F